MFICITVRPNQEETKLTADMISLSLIKSENAISVYYRAFYDFLYTVTLSIDLKITFPNVLAARVIYDLLINTWLCCDFTTLPGCYKFNMCFLTSTSQRIYTETWTITRREHSSLLRGMSHDLSFKDEEELFCPLRERERERERERTASSYFWSSIEWMGLCTALKGKQRMRLIQDALISSPSFLLCLFVLQTQWASFNIETSTEIILR